MILSRMKCPHPTVIWSLMHAIYDISWSIFVRWSKINAIESKQCFFLLMFANIEESNHVEWWCRKEVDSEGIDGHGWIASFLLVGGGEWIWDWNVYLFSGDCVWCKSDNSRLCCEKLRCFIYIYESGIV